MFKTIAIIIGICLVFAGGYDLTPMPLDMQEAFAEVGHGGLTEWYTWSVSHYFN